VGLQPFALLGQPLAPVRLVLQGQGQGSAQVRPWPMVAPQQHLQRLRSELHLENLEQRLFEPNAWLGRYTKLP